MNPIFIFDIDGVITHPHVKKPNDFTLSFIAKKLHENQPVALATGRAVAWIEKNIMPELQKKIISKSDLDNLFICGEKGGVWIEFRNGKLNFFVDQRINFPQKVMDKLRNHVEKLKGVFYDPDKYTMISVEIEGGKDPEKIREQKEILRDLEIWVKREILPEFPGVYTDLSEISVDILAKGINKKIAGKKFLQFLLRKNFQADNFVIFGDSPSDALVAQLLFEKGKNVKFFYVGKEFFSDKYNFPVVKSQNNFYDTAVEEILHEAV